MSHSPQTLAKRSSRRSRQVPARFDDFSEIPQEYYYRNVFEQFQAKKELPKGQHDVDQATRKSNPKRSSSASLRSRSKPSKRRRGPPTFWDSDSETSIDEPDTYESSHTPQPKHGISMNDTPVNLEHNVKIKESQANISGTSEDNEDLPDDWDSSIKSKNNPTVQAKQAAQSKRPPRPASSKHVLSCPSVDSEKRISTLPLRIEEQLSLKQDSYRDEPKIQDPIPNDPGKQVSPPIQRNKKGSTPSASSSKTGNQNTQINSQPTQTSPQSFTTKGHISSIDNSEELNLQSSHSSKNIFSPKWRIHKSDSPIRARIYHPPIDAVTLKPEAARNGSIVGKHTDKITRELKESSRSVERSLDEADNRSGKKACQDVVRTPQKTATANPLSLLKPIGNSSINRPSALSSKGQEQNKPRSSPKRCKMPKLREFLVNSTPIQHQQQPPQPQTQSKQANLYVADATKNRAVFPHNMQYRSRLLLNEPILLPTSVGKIDPITSSYADLVKRSKKYPFVSRRTEAMLAFQEERKINTMISFHAALIKIANSIEVRDLLNLRMANKTWKSVIDSDAAWRVVTVETSKITDWKSFLSHIFRKQHTQELILVDQLPKLSPFYFAKQIVLFGPNMRHLTIETKTPQENQFYLEMLSRLRELMRPLRGEQTDLVAEKAATNQASDLEDTISRQQIEVIWKVRILIDEHGLAYVPLVKPKDNCNYDPMELPFCYMSHPEWMEPDDTFLVEISEISELFAPGAPDDESSSTPAAGLRVTLELT